MGLLGFLLFSLNYLLHELAWPLFALVYPLYASIRAIEANSVLDTQKLNIYWVVFSLILLLEHIFKLLEWFPFWTSIRLVTVFLLVMPYFDGAFYVYKHVILPCLSLDPPIIVNWFAKLKHTSVERETILAEVEKYISENGTEALEKIIACKSESTNNPNDKEIKAVSPVDDKVIDQFNSDQPNVARKDIKAEEVIEKNEVNAAAQGTGAGHHETKDFLSKEILFGTIICPKSDDKEIKAASPVDDKVIDQFNANGPNVARKDIKAEETIEKNEVNAATQASRVETKLDWGTENRTLPSKTKETVPEVAEQRELLPRTPPKLVPREWSCTMCHVKCQSLTSFMSHLLGKRHKDNEEAAKPRASHLHQKPKNSASNGEKQKTTIKTNMASVIRLRCRVCNFSCTSKIDMDSHLRERKHLTQVQLSRSNQ